MTRVKFNKLDWPDTPDWEWDFSSPDLGFSTSTSTWKAGPPKFCEYCGERLVENDMRDTRYDKYTGEPYHIGIIMYVCPNWGSQRQQHTREPYDPNRGIDWLTYTNSTW
jgi:hypothetical protein